MQVRESSPSTNAQLFYDTRSVRSQGSPVSLSLSWLGQVWVQLKRLSTFLVTLTALNQDTSLDWVESMTRTEIQVLPVSM